MADWFDFKGVRSSTHGIHVTEFPPIPLAEERVTFKAIPGRSGALTLTEGDGIYEDVTLKIGCYVGDTAQITAIAAWLTGSGDLILGNRPDRRYVARAINQIDLEKVMRGRSARTFEAVFRCHPLPYLYPAAADIEITGGTGTFTSPATEISLPLITLRGTGDMNLIVNGRTVLLDDVEGSIVIDCEAKLAYKGAALQCGKVTLMGGWPQITPGVNSVSYTGATGCVIAPRYRYR